MDDSENFAMHALCFSRHHAGKDAYLDCTKLTLRRQRGLLSRVQYDIVKASRLGPNELKVRWSISWVPQSMERFVLLGEILPGMKVHHKLFIDVSALMYPGCVNYGNSQHDMG